MRHPRYIEFILELILSSIFWPSIYADVSVWGVQDQTSPANNVPDIQPAHNKLAGYRSEGPKDEEEEHIYVNQLPPTPFQRIGSSPPSGSIQYQQPVVKSRRQQSEIYYKQKKYSPDMNYVMKAGGQEKHFAEDMRNEYQSPTPDFPSPEGKDQPMEYRANKKMNYEKSYNNYKYSYSSNGLHSPERERVPKYTHPSPRLLADKRAAMDFYAAKSTSWKQLGPNVEISTSAEAEHPLNFKRDLPSEPPKNANNKKRKPGQKNMRSGYLNQQHALYIANNLANLANLPLRPVKGAFDHNNVLKQSDKFELSDAMFQELEEAAKKNNEPSQVRIKQETPKDQYYKYQPEINNPYQQYYPDPYVGKYYQPHPVSSLSKGFIRNIEIETNTGAKRMIPALIIPLSPDQLNNQLFNQEIGIYVNNPEVLNPGSRMRYEMMNSRYSQSSEPYNAFGPAENYQYHQQVASPYDFRVAEDYSPYVNYQAQNLYRLPYNLNNVPATPAGVEAKSPEIRATPFSPKKKPSHKAANYQPQPIQANRLSQVHPSESSKVNYKRDEYVFDANKDEHYLAASESFTTVTSIKDKDQKMVEKIEMKA